MSDFGAYPLMARRLGGWLWWAFVGRRHPELWWGPNEYVLDWPALPVARVGYLVPDHEGQFVPIVDADIDQELAKDERDLGALGDGGAGSWRRAVGEPLAVDDPEAGLWLRERGDHYLGSGWWGSGPVEPVGAVRQWDDVLVSRDVVEQAGFDHPCSDARSACRGRSGRPRLGWPLARRVSCLALGRSSTLHYRACRPVILALVGNLIRKVRSFERLHARWDLNPQPPV